MRLQRRGTPKSRGAMPPGMGDPGAEQPPGRPRRRYDPAWNDWNTPRRWPGILLSCVIVLGFLGVVIWHLRPHATVHHPTVAFNEGTKPPKAPYLIPVRGTRAISFSGTHNMGGLHFVSDGRLLVLHAKCTCQYNFIVSISNPGLVPISFPVNATGHVDTVLNATVPAGPILISVRGVGKWSLQFVQPLATTPAIHGPFTYYSSNNDVIGPFPATDKYLKFQFLSLSGGTVAVHVLDAQGFGLATPFGGRSAVSKSATLASPPSPYFLEVDATGFWNLNVAGTPPAP